MRGMPALYIKLHTLSTVYTLFSPGTNFVARFYGADVSDAPSFANFGTSGLHTTDKFAGFVKRAFSNPLALGWSIWVVVYLTTFYVATLAGVRAYFSQNWRNIWSILLFAGGCLIFLLGPAGTSRYRFALLQAFLPLAAFGVSHWINRKHPGQNHASMAVS